MKLRKLIGAFPFGTHAGQLHSASASWGPSGSRIVGVMSMVGAGIVQLTCASAALAQSTAADPATSVSTSVDSTSNEEAPAEVSSVVAQAAPQPAETPTAAANPAPAPAASPSAADYDKVYGWKGWNIPFPSFANTVMQDKGGIRTSLANHGIGLLIMNDSFLTTNLYDSPRGGPVYNPYFRTNQTYNGQKSTYSHSTQFLVTYDLGRLGLPGGQLQYQQSLACSTYDPGTRCMGSIAALSYYQSMLNNQLELRAGVYALQYDFAGAFVAGNLSNALGPGSQPLTLVGVSSTQATTPAIRLKWNFANGFYAQGAVARSLAQGGPSGNPYIDTAANNWRNLGWSGNLPNTKTLYIGEVGYKVAPKPGQPSTWLRGGAVYNASNFADFSKFGVKGAPKTSGNSAFYFLFDRQLTQPATTGFAGRGLYVGGAATYADPKMTAITQSYDARIYYIGPFDSRPSDILSIVGGYQVNSRYLVNAVNANSAVSGTYGAKNNKSLTLAYLAKIATGVYVRTSVNYLTNPTVTYFGPSAANPEQPFTGKGLLFGLQLTTHF